MNAKGLVIFTYSDTRMFRTETIEFRLLRSFCCYKSVQKPSVQYNMEIKESKKKLHDLI